jgi:serine/threonine-protein kinase
MTRKFGPYEILDELKSGGMGAVLLARRRGPGAFEQLVAIKTIRPEYASTPAVRAMFLDEAAILARLNHPGVATVHDFGEEGGTLYMVMEYVAGIPFRDVGELRPPPGVVARAIAEACRGLHAAHELRDHQGNVLGVVHRDISPDNLMLGYDGHVKVIDFGIALVKNRAAPVTEIGTVKGKPPYMSPEQVKNEPMDRRSDVFSLGVVAWEMLTGQGLFDGDSIYAIALAVEQQVIAPPSAIAGELPLGLDGAILNALDRDVASRTPTAAALAEQLEGVISAAGSETLEAWAERALEEPRVAHREWLARAAAGDAAPVRVGRPTGMVTALPEQAAPGAGAGASGALEKSEADAAGVLSPSPTHLAAEVREPGDADLPPPRKPIRAALLVALALLIVGGGAAMVATRHGDERAPAIARDAGAIVTALAGRDASAVIPVAVPDAALVTVPVPVDAMEADAGGHAQTIHRDAAIARPPREAAAPAPDAAVVVAVPAATGSGVLALTAQPYANVVIDGASIGPTPQMHYKIAAGAHTVKFLDPTNGAVLATQTITVHDGDHLALHP